MLILKVTVAADGVGMLILKVTVSAGGVGDAYT